MERELAFKEFCNRKITIEWRNRYSDTDESDEFGRWARIPYYKKYRIGWCSKANDKFIIQTTFPIDQSDSAHGVNTFNTYEECQFWITSEWYKFKKNIL